MADLPKKALTTFVYDIELMDMDLNTTENMALT